MLYMTNWEYLGRYDIVDEGRVQVSYLKTLASDIQRA